MVYRYGATRAGHDSRSAASTHNVTGTGNTSPPPEEQESARQRILCAAIDLYGEHGFDGVTVKTIAERAGISAPLVIHHFGSKAGLRTACDRYVAEQFREAKTASVRRGAMPRNVAHEAVMANRNLVKYLMRAFVAGGPEMDDLFDQLVEDSLSYTSEAEELGLVYPSRNSRHRAVLLLLHSFGTLMLHRHLERHLGLNLLQDDPDTAGLDAYMATIMEIYTQPLFNAETYAELLEADLAAAERPAAEAPAADGTDDAGH